MKLYLEIIMGYQSIQ